MRSIIYTSEFYRSEIERLTLNLLQSIKQEERLQIQRELASARDHLADLNKTPRTA